MVLMPPMLEMKVVLHHLSKITMKLSYYWKKPLEKQVMKVKQISVWMLLLVNSSWMENMIWISKTPRMMEAKDYLLINQLICTQVSLTNTQQFQSKTHLTKMIGKDMLHLLRKLEKMFKSQEMIYQSQIPLEFKKLLTEKHAMLYY